MSDIGKAIKIARLNAGKSQKEVAEHIGVSLSYISKIEQGVRVPTDAVLVQLEEFLGVTLSENRGSNVTYQGNLERDIIFKVYEMSPATKRALWEFIKGIQEESATSDRELAPVG